MLLATRRGHHRAPAGEHKPNHIGPDTEDFQIVGVVVGAIIESRRTEDTHKAAQAA